MKRSIQQLAAWPPVVSTIRTLTLSQRFPDRFRERVHRRVCKSIPLEGQFDVDLFGHDVVVEHGGIWDYFFWLGEYEPETTRLFRSLLDGADLVIDIGARDGVFSFIAAAASPSTTVLAFEPDPQAKAALDRNIARNRAAVGERILTSSVAISDTNGQARFFLSHGTSSLNPAFRAGAEPIDVDVRTGDSVLAELAADRAVALMKIDTESTEPQVLAGFAGRIERDRPAIIVEVLAGRTEEDLEDFAVESGYNRFAIRAEGAVPVDRIVGDPTYEFPNFLLLPRERPLPPGLVGPF